MPASCRSAASGRASSSKARASAASASAALLRPFGQRLDKISEAKTGEIVALAKVDVLSAGQSLSAAGIAPTADFPAADPPVFALSLAAKNRNDEVKLSGALHKIVEEDPSLSFEARGETHELLIKGQGEMHLKVAVDKLAGRYNVAVETTTPRVAYRETIQAGSQQHARYKRQTGGHGQFADIKVEIKPLPRGSGFRFVDKIVGGVVPRNFIPAVEEGLFEYTKEGPLGQPVVDLEVTLFDGQFHAVDSSEMSFKMAARIAMSEAMPKCRPVLLEPILKVTVAAPSESTPRIQRLISGRRGQLLGYDARAGWNGWDEVSALMPEAEIADMIVEIRSVTQGVGTFRTEFDHLQELVGRTADRIVEETKKRAAAKRFPPAWGVPQPGSGAWIRAHDPPPAARHLLYNGRERAFLLQAWIILTPWPMICSVASLAPMRRCIATGATRRPTSWAFPSSCSPCCWCCRCGASSWAAANGRCRSPWRSWRSWDGWRSISASAWSWHC